jgi:hypothetical protein
MVRAEGGPDHPAANADPGSSPGRTLPCSHGNLGEVTGPGASTRTCARSPTGRYGDERRDGGLIQQAHVRSRRRSEISVKQCRYGSLRRVVHWPLPGFACLVDDASPNGPIPGVSVGLND